MAAKASSRNAKLRVFFAGKLDMNSPATLEKFRKAAAAHTADATKSKDSAVKTLKRERIITLKGKLTKTYSQKT